MKGSFISEEEAYVKTSQVTGQMLDMLDSEFWETNNHTELIILRIARHHASTVSLV